MSKQLTKWKLTPAGEAYKKSAEDKNSPAKGVIITKYGSVDIKTLTDQTAEYIKDTPYVELVK